MKSELDKVLDSIPSVITVREGIEQGQPAIVWFDVAGRLNILLANGNWLGLDEKQFGHLQADIEVEIPR